MKINKLTDKYSVTNLSATPKINQLRVWHIPQVPMKQGFYVPVDSIKDAKLVLDTLARYDLFQYAFKIKPDYTNAAGLEVYDGTEWFEWYDEEGNDIDKTMFS